MPSWKSFEMRALNPCGVAFLLPCKLKFNIFLTKWWLLFCLTISLVGQHHAFLMLVPFHFLEYFFVNLTAVHIFDDLLEGFTGPKEGDNHVCGLLQQKKRSRISKGKGHNRSRPGKGTLSPPVWHCRACAASPSTELQQHTQCFCLVQPWSLSLGLILRADDIDTFCLWPAVITKTPAPQKASRCLPKITSFAQTNLDKLV